MGSRIEHRGEFTGSLENVFTAVAGEEALQARLEALGGDDAKLLAYTAEGDSVRYELQHGIKAAKLPQAVRALHKGDIIVNRTQTWKRSGDEYTGRSDVGVGGVPGEIGASTYLSPKDGKVLLRTTGEVVVRIPLFGGRIEEFVSEQVVNLLRREDEFTAQWLAEHA
ncbi:DUF2505 domain-containing protein [Amycolatopsis rubida]|uniref:DUF2505 domain-containing protein n=1 Tax=Amycolatopsis rubida TaxID=112413 RepID=A0A1I5DNJ4_9PSEU|nr:MULTISPECIES: DUF2505 domain-containing protein [Amycolatopsis]MYW92530.1 DUF2505 family protein [Amycolatopsis rubida]NEC57516.1 DUF2505 domain-containing protein [Amycolatopsis rubida]OAP20089.1 hypothetical protein A4R44_09213 [Amycolatopsis sp. M39]SFO00812.1 Protein of unknown function [Amycolatopsis rubida]